MLRAHLKRRLVIAAALLSLPTLAASVWSWTILRYVKPYEQIARGDTEARVVALMGRPARVSTDDRYPPMQTWDASDSFGTAGVTVARYYWYPLPSITGDEYVIGFDAEGHAVVKNKLISP